MDKPLSPFRWAWVLIALALVTGCATADKPAASAATQPKLVVVVLVDGLPQEQLTRNHDLLGPNGLRRLMDRGAWFSDAHQAHAFTVTAVGHASVFTGATHLVSARQVTLSYSSSTSSFSSSMAGRLLILPGSATAPGSAAWAAS